MTPQRAALIIRSGLAFLSAHAPSISAITDRKNLAARQLAEFSPFGNNIMHFARRQFF